MEDSPKQSSVNKSECEFACLSSFFAFILWPVLP